MEAFSMIVLAVYALIGGVSTLYLLFSMPAVAIWKIYRKVTMGKRLTD